MSKTVKDWTTEIKNCTDSELSQLLTSIENLKGWEAFHEAFKWTNYHIISTIIEIEIRLRKTGNSNGR